MNWLRDYLYLASWKPLLAGSAVVLCGIGAILEGSALAFLLPVIQHGLSNTPPVLEPWALWINVPQTNVTSAALILFLAFGISAAVVRFASEGMFLRLRTRIECLARELMGRALLRMDWPAYLGLKLGDISKAQIIEGQQMAIGTQAFLQGLGACLAVLCYLVVAFSISPEMTLYTLLFGVLGAVFYKIASLSARKHAEAWSGSVSSIGERLSEIFSSLKYVRSTGMVPAVERRAVTLYRESERVLFLSQLYSLGNRMVFETAGIIFIAAFLAYRLADTSQGIASGLIFLAVFYRLAPRLQQIQDAFFLAQNYHSWVETWRNRIRHACSQESHDGGLKKPNFVSDISINHVSYRYPGAESLALNDVSLTIQRGETIAIVGGSGGGKTTLTDLITGLIRPDAGQIMLGEQPFTDVDIDAWRRQVGVVMQETPLIHDSVLANIVWGTETIDADWARECARMAHAMDFIEQLPEEMNTVIGERGGRLSGGQKQRIALARALYRRPALLILDEPTSALDSESEWAVRDALIELKGHCTMLIVSHRLRTVQFSDRIVVLEHGRVIQCGRWDDLIRNGDGRLSQLVAIQEIA